jgi:hypothetical protein
MVSVRLATSWKLLVAALVTLGLLAGVSRAIADPFFNSSETGCNGSDPNVLLCDDFEDGTWFEENADVANSNGGIDTRTDGWAGRIRDGYPHAVCGGAGFKSNCAARSILQGGSDGGNSALADHNLAPSTGPGRGSEYTEYYARFYFKRLSPFTFNNNQKFMSINPCCANDGGIFFGGIGDGSASGKLVCPMWDCNLEDNYRNPQNPGNSVYLYQNQGKDLDTRTLLDHWVYYEYHWKLNTYNVRNGVVEVWMNDCGTTGTSCTGTPTLRARYTNVGWSGVGTGGTAPRHDAGAGVFFFDIWGNPSDGGTILFDQLKVSKIGPIGFAGASGPTDSVAPAGPTNPQIR